MAIAITCSCGEPFNVKDEAAGKRAKCSACGNLMPDSALNDPPEGERQEAISFANLQQLISSGKLNSRDLAWEAVISDCLPASPEIGEVPETILLQKRGVTVTDARFILPGHAYDVSGITSVRSGKRTRAGPALVVTFLALCGIGCLLSVPIDLLGGQMGLLQSISVTGLGFLMLVVCWQISKGLYQHVVMLTTAAGQRQAYISPDHEFVAELIQALNKAIVVRE